MFDELVLRHLRHELAWIADILDDVTHVCFVENERFEVLEDREYRSEDDLLVLEDEDVVDAAADADGQHASEESHDVLAHVHGAVDLNV